MSGKAEPTATDEVELPGEAPTARKASLSEQIEELCDFRSLLETRAMRASMASNGRALIADLQDSSGDEARV
jgi:hypothetical protein